MMRGPLAKAFGGGEAGAYVADYILAIQHDLPLPVWEKPGETVPNPLDPADPANIEPPL